MPERVGTIMRDARGQQFLVQPLDGRPVRRVGRGPLVGEVLDVDDERQFRGTTLRHRMEIPNRAYGLAERMVKVAERGQMALIAILIAALVAAVWTMTRRPPRLESKR